MVAVARSSCRNNAIVITFGVVHDVMFSRVKAVRSARMTGNADRLDTFAGAKSAIPDLCLIMSANVSLMSVKTLPQHIVNTSSLNLFNDGGQM